jgi:hypothetical protein
LSQDLKLALIQVDHDIQIREATNTDVINEYADNLENLPPITVFYDGKTYWLADGFHRFAAATKLNRMKIACEVINGTKREAILYACGANSGHGLRRTNEDKRRAVERLLADEEWASWTDNRIAKAAGVSQPFVGSIRRQVITVITSSSVQTVTVDEPEVGNPISEKRTGTDGKQYPAKKKAAEIVPETPQTAPEPSKRQRDLEAFRKAKSAAKQHNNAMVRFIDTMNELRTNPGLHRKALQHFEGLDKIFGEWSE